MEFMFFGPAKKQTTQPITLTFSQLDVWVNQVDRHSTNIIQQAIEKAAEYHGVNPKEILVRG